MAMLAFLLAAGCTQSPVPAHKPAVRISKEGKKYVLYRNDTPFIVKGAAGFTHMRQLREAGGNTVRVWDTAQLGRILDEAHAHQLAVIAGLPMPVSSILSFYQDTAKTAAQYSAFRAVVNRYKSHPALLMWCLGNEVDFPYRPKFKPFYKAYNRLLNMIHADDPDHPVTTAVINMNHRMIYNIRWKVDGLDLISVNIFGSLRYMDRHLSKLSWAWSGPFLITEWGINGPWESDGTTAWGAPIERSSGRKAEQYLQLYKYMPVNNPRFLGACVFFWGQKQETTHTWFSLFSDNGASSQAVNVMQFLWTNRWPEHNAPALKEVRVDGKGAWDNILLNPATVHTAEMVFDALPGDSIRIKWELLKEDWYMKNWYEPNLKKPASFDSLLLSCEGYKVTFRAPAKTGPYRIFATVFDDKGRFAAANTPFYVVGP
ncbi:glycoside hydrolase family 2 TIM barrel-domain containing protein [Chitinophaga lutea]|nr:glycoside hydrolase family 2 TIM barrel-domain containing protein [Chitinophaga lutea]